MGMRPIHHRIVVMIKEFKVFKKNVMGKSGLEAGHIGTREGERVLTGAGKQKWPRVVRTLHKPACMV